MRSLGYVKATESHQTEGQLVALDRAGCEILFIDRQNGQEWGRFEAMAQAGDKVVVRDIEVVSDSQSDLVELIKRLQQRKIDIAIIDAGIDTGAAGGVDIVQALEALANLRPTNAAGGKTAPAPTSVPAPAAVSVAGASAPSPAPASAPETGGAASRPLVQRESSSSKKAGRPRTAPEKLEQARQLYEEQNMTAEQACQSVGISRRTFFNYLAQHRPVPSSIPESPNP